MFAVNMASAFRPGTPVGHRNFPDWHGHVEPDATGRCYMESTHDVRVHWDRGRGCSGQVPVTGWYEDEFLVPESDLTDTAFGGTKTLFSFAANGPDGEDKDGGKMRTATGPQGQPIAGIPVSPVPGPYTTGHGREAALPPGEPEPGKAIICPWHGPQLGIACLVCARRTERSRSDG